MDFNLDKGFRIDPTEVDGDWDHIYVYRGTSTAVVITKYKCLDKNGCLMSPDKWTVKAEYDTSLGTKYYREEKLQELLK